MDAIDANKPVQQDSSGAPPSHLTIILDTSPRAWAQLSSAYNLPLHTFVAHLLVFTNAHLAFSTDNHVAILAVHLGRTHWLYPIPDGSSPLPPVNANKYRPFAVVESAVLSRLNALLAETTPEDIAASTDTTPLAGPLTLALAYVNRLNMTLGPGSSSAPASAAADAYQSAPHARALNARILLASVSAADLSAQYIPLTNAMFAAQHARVPIDVLKLAGGPALLQQAAYTTGGRYIAPAGLPAADPTPKSSTGTGAGTARANLLPYLLHAMLPDPAARMHMVAPTSPKVDFRAACFCHRRVVDTGFVCSICLSIFCSADELGPGMACLTCGTALVLGGDGADDLVVDGAAGAGPGKKKKKDKKARKDGAGSGAGTPMRA